MEFQQSRTYANLQNAYELELGQSTLYSIYGDILRQAGYRQIADVYDIFQRNNKEHARIWYRQLNEGNLPNSEEALSASIQQEYYMGNQLYREYAQIANEEGYSDIGALFNGVANIDLNHGLQLQNYYNDVIRDQVFCKDDENLWICMQCGNILSGFCAPERCPICGFPQSFYRLYGQDPV